jgi:ABC-type transporter Mla subunit MlaD
MAETLDSLQKSLNVIQAGNAAIAQDLQTISDRQKKLTEGLKKVATAGSAARNELQDLANQAEEIAKSVAQTTQKAEQAAHPAHAGQGLPGQGRPDQGLPGSPGHPDQGLPPSPGHPSQGLPNAPAKPDQGLPPTGQPKK